MLTFVEQMKKAREFLGAPVLFLSQSVTGNTTWGSRNDRVEVFVCATCGHTTTADDDRSLCRCAHVQRAHAESLAGGPAR